MGSTPLRPTLSQSASGRGRLDAASRPFGRVVSKHSRRTQAVGIAPLKMDEMFSGLGDMDKHSSHELQGVEKLLVIDLVRSEEHTSELQSRLHLVCRLL